MHLIGAPDLVYSHSKYRCLIKYIFVINELQDNRLTVFGLIIYAIIWGSHPDICPYLGTSFVIKTLYTSDKMLKIRQFCLTFKLDCKKRHICPLWRLWSTNPLISGHDVRILVRITRILSISAELLIQAVAELAALQRKLSPRAGSHRLIIDQFVRSHWFVYATSSCLVGSLEFIVYALCHCPFHCVCRKCIHIGFANFIV